MKKSLFKKNLNYTLIINLIIFLLIFIAFTFSVSALNKKNTSEQILNLEKTIRRDIVNCYAVEGKYPPDIEYLINHYGLTYDEENYYIDYLPIGSNIMPDYTVIYIGD